MSILKRSTILTVLATAALTSCGKINDAQGQGDNMNGYWNVTQMSRTDASGKKTDTDMSTFAIPPEIYLDTNKHEVATCIIGTRGGIGWERRNYDYFKGFDVKSEERRVENDVLITTTTKNDGTVEVSIAVKDKDSLNAKAANAKGCQFDL